VECHYAGNTTAIYAAKISIEFHPHCLSAWFRSGRDGASSPTWNAPVGTSPGWQPCQGCKVSRDWPSFANACLMLGGLPCCDTLQTLLSPFRSRPPARPRRS
jgi:hypothetical protein